MALIKLIFTELMSCTSSDQQPSIEKDPTLDCLPAYWTLVHSVTTHLACTMATHEDHVLQTIHAHWATSLKDRMQPLFKDSL